MPGLVSFPSASTLAEASAMCMRASAWEATLRNCDPNPFPSQEPLIRPGRSISWIGMKREPSMQVEFRGLSLTPSSLHTQIVFAFAWPMLGFLVVKGYVETSAVRRVAALKNVVLPAFVLPISPTFSKNLQ